MAMTFGVGLIALPVVLFSMLLPIALLVVLQVWLCRKSLRLGLILPAISLAGSLLPTLLIAVNLRHFGLGVFLLLGVFFLAANLPTVVFGGIWLHFKGRQSTLEDLKRMRIEDLE